MTIPTIALKVEKKQYSKLVEIGNTVLLGLAGNPTFVTPAVPLSELQSAVATVEGCIAAWGTKHNRGSHADLVNLQVQAQTLHQLLKVEAAYVKSIAGVAAGNDYGLMATLMLSSGFALKAARHSQGVLGKVQNLRFMASGALNRNSVKLVWDKPLEVTSRGNVKSNVIYRSLTTNFADAVAIATVSKKEFIDTNNIGATVTWSYFIAALGAAGLGAISDPITITLLSA